MIAVGSLRRLRRSARVAEGLGLLALALACSRESPTSVGGPLLPGDAVRSFEVILEAPSWLVVDTAVSGFDDPFGADFQLVAREFQGTLNAHTLARFEIPTVIAAPDSNNTTRNDSTPHFIGGRIVLQLDTLRSEGQKPVRYQAQRIEEEWDPASANWLNRVDSGSVRLPWSQPGALGGAIIDTASWEAGVDSVAIPVDSATIALWADTLTKARGAVILTLTSGARVRSSDVVLRLDARPTFRPDTVVTVTVRPPDPTFIFEPSLGQAGPAPLVGGLPSWRTYLQFRERMDTLTVACPQVSAECRVRLGDATVTYAGLVLHPTQSPPGFLPQDSMRLGTRPVLVSPLAPLERSPLGPFTGVAEDFLLPSRFLPQPASEPVEVPLTPFMRDLVTDTLPSDDPPSRWVAVLPLVEGVDFGMAAFEPMPRLRLVLTIANQLQLR